MSGINIGYSSNSHLVVGRSEGAFYPNNNLDYRQFDQKVSNLNKKWCICNKEGTCLGCLIDKAIEKELGKEGLNYLSQFKLK